MTLATARRGLRLKKEPFLRRKKNSRMIAICSHRAKSEIRRRVLKETRIFLRVNILGQQQRGDQDQDFLIQGDQSGSCFRIDRQKKDEKIPVHPGYRAGDLDGDKESRILKRATANPLLSSIPMATGPSRFPVNETRLLPLPRVRSGIALHPNMSVNPRQTLYRCRVQPGLLPLEKATHAESEIKTKHPDQKPLPQRPGLYKKRKKGDANFRHPVG